MYKLIAHRGNKEKAFENTLKAFYDAINSDYVGFECDVRVTKDNILIIYHDSLYKGKLIKNMLYKDLDNILTLKDVLNIQTNKIIMLDIKDPFLDVKLLLKEINKHSYLNIYVISFYKSILDKLNIANKKYEVGLLNYVLNYDNNYDFICIMGVFLNLKIISKFQKENKKLFVYNIKRKDIKYSYPYYIIDNN